ncbi:hypothetical protein [Pararhizobium arenae]|uniref:hypothetical protein n=1 Tax=Pararhizobium arenae TaxID=1856850 RepID=UPI0009FA3758|nr:hypothetical protein [Pararhizobium arenae]
MPANETNALKLAQEYLSLGGTRRSKIGDNIVDVRQLEREPQEATSFWETRIAPLPLRKRNEVETHLPSMNDI